MMDTADRLWETLDRYVSAEGVELDDVEVLGSGAGKVVRVTVDAEEGIDVERIAVVSRGLSRLLEETASFAGTYTLEVSSPGLERSLRKPEHFRKSIGREVTIRTSGPVEDATSHRGTLTAADDTAATVTVDGVERAIPYAAISNARTVFVVERAPKPGKRSAR
jgi:ribosome maturation factor RimP